MFRSPLMLLVCLCTSLNVNSLFAQQALSLAAPISDHMVLQHGKATSVWGWADRGSAITVEFGDQTLQTKAASDGSWKVSLRPLRVSANPQVMKVNSNHGDSAASLTVKDILVGEVWMCSGQSNMAFKVSNHEFFKADIEQANFPQIRFFNTTNQTAETPQQNCEGSWQTVTPQTVSQCTAVGFFFGREIHQSLKVPVGLAMTAWGGKPVEAFTSYEKLQSVSSAKPLLAEWNQSTENYSETMAKKAYEAAMEKWQAQVTKLRAQAKATGTKPKRFPRRPALAAYPPLSPNYPGAIYNQEIAPWTSYAIAGAIWYQGESNRARADQYRSLMPALIEDWRAKWKFELPFYLVQLANFQQPTDDPNAVSDWAQLQDAQTHTIQTVPHTGMAVINDIGDATNIHPVNKRDAGKRLARWALKQTYAKPISPYASPLYRSHEIKGNAIHIKFDHVGQGLKSRDGGPLKHFAIAGKDRTFVWADAKIDQSKSLVIVSSDKVADPVAVRYAWASNAESANLVNSAELPASLFRTDQWPLSTVGVNTRRGPKPKQSSPSVSEQRGFKPLFNGKDLSGWNNVFDNGEAKVVNGEIHLLADKKFFLTTEKSYRDFELTAEIKLPEGKANSGIMFRCHVEPNKVYGYQAECDGSERRWSGGLYDEGRRGWIWPSQTGRTKEEKFLKHEEESKAFFATRKVRDALKRNDWNRYEIRCQGDSIRISVNGVQTTDIKDDTDAAGHIGIQHHGEKGQTYRFRNIYIRQLD